VAEDESTQGKLEVAIKEHHRCSFDQAIETLETVLTDAKKLSSVLRAIRQIDRTAADGGPSVPVSGLRMKDNPFFDPQIIENDVSSRLDGGASCSLDQTEKTVSFEYRDDSQLDHSSRTAGRTRGESSSDEANGEQDTDVEIVDGGVNWLFRSIRDGRDPVTIDESDSRVVIAREDVMKPYDTAEVMKHAADHVEEQTAVETTVDRSQLPDAIVFTIDSEPGDRPTRRQVGEQLVQSFENNPRLTGHYQ
jgi:hypothetical protein